MEKTINEFPKNDEIRIIEKAIEELKTSKSWEAIVWAKSDLRDLLNERDVWLENG